MVKLSENRIERNILNVIKNIHETTVNITFNIEIFSISTHRQRTMQGCLFLSHLFNIVLEILTIATRQEKEIKGKIRKEEIKL